MRLAGSPGRRAIEEIVVESENPGGPLCILNRAARITVPKITPLSESHAVVFRKRFRHIERTSKAYHEVKILDHRFPKGQEDCCSRIFPTPGALPGKRSGQR